MSLTTGHLATLLGARLIGRPDIAITGADAADRALPGQVTFARTTRFAAAWMAGRASAVLVAKDLPLSCVMDDAINLLPGPDRAVLIVPDADLALIRVLEMLMPKAAPPAPGVDAGAHIDPLARVDPGASIGPNCTVQAGAVIASGAVLVANVCVGRNARVGAGTVVHASVVIADRCEVGAHCTLHGGVVIGADGFGYYPSPDGRGVLKVPHIGNAVLHDHVEVGANSCIDRAKFGSTIIGAGTKIDNLVQVGHNCRLGRSCILCGQSGLAGSVILGDGVLIGGGARVMENVEIGAGAKIAGFSGVNNNVPAGAEYMGMPAGPASEWRRIYGFLRRMGRNRGNLGNCLLYTSDAADE